VRRAYSWPHAARIRPAVTGWRVTSWRVTS
jgi:hypothetical protein